MTNLPTDAIRACFAHGSTLLLADAEEQLSALTADRDMWRNRALGLKECLHDVASLWQTAWDYPSKHDKEGDTQ